MPKRILLVDDEVDFVTVIKSRLESKGFEVLVARDGMDALDKAKEESPDIILLDVMLPKVDGYRVCRMLKFDEKYKEIPIIMLTAKGKESDKEIGEEVKADAYMTKPFEVAVLLERINELLEK